MAIGAEIILRLIVAVIAGGLIGIERRKSHKPAGCGRICLFLWVQLFLL